MANRNLPFDDVYRDMLSYAEDVGRELDDLFDDQQVVLEPFEQDIWALELVRGKIFVSGFRQCVNCIRAVGSRISNLSIDYSTNDDQDPRQRSGQLNAMINTHCVSSLRTITLTRMPREALGGCRRPFKNVRRVVLFNEEAELPSPFSTIFPNIHEFFFDEMLITVTQINEFLFHLPTTLREFSCYFNEAEDYSSFQDPQSRWRLEILREEAVGDWILLKLHRIH